MSLLRFTSLIILTFIFSGCDLLEDTDLNPIYFVECEVDGDKKRAQTKQEAYLTWFAITGDQYSVTGQDQISNFHISLTLFKVLGEGRIPIGTKVGIYLTDISLFRGGKTYTAVQHGGSGWVDVEKLTDTEAEGTFEADLIELQGGQETVSIRNGKFKVITN